MAPAEANLTFEGEFDAYDALRKRYVWTARGFGGRKRFYQVSVDYNPNPEVRRISEETAKASMEYLLRYEYRDRRGRFRAAIRDLKMAWNAKVLPLCIRFAR